MRRAALLASGGANSGRTVVLLGVEPERFPRVLALWIIGVTAHHLTTDNSRDDMS